MSLKWLKEISDKWSAGIAHVFLLHGNTADTIDGTSTPQDVLLRSSLCKRDIVVCYNRSQGMTFPLESHKQNFYEAIGLDMELDGEADLPKDPVPAMSLMERVLGKMTKTDRGMVPKTAVIISFAESIFPANDIANLPPDERTALVTLQRWARNGEFVHAGCPVFLITENLPDINPVLRNASARVEAVNLPLPDYEERVKFLEGLAVEKGIEIENTQQIAAMTAALKRLHLDDIALRAVLENSPITVELVKTRKDEIIRQEFAEVLEMVDPEYGYDILAGVDHAVNLIRKSVELPIKAGNLRRVPMGILLTGPPGTGKTLLAECLAKETGINCAKLNLAKIFNSFVGGSERNLEKALACLDALTPCIVIVDELDQSGLSRGGSGDSGVSNRLFKRLLEFMSDTRHRGKIVFVGITNRPDLLDAALKRPGRLDKKIPILPPNAEGRKGIFEVMFKKYNIEYNLDLGPVAETTEGYTGAEIEALVLKALEVAEDAESTVIESRHMDHALDAYIPTTRDIQQMVRLAVAECSDKDLLPEEYRHLLEERKKEQATAVPQARANRVL